MTVRLRPEEHEDLVFIAELWNEYDRASGVKRRKKWKVSTVIDQFLSDRIASFWQRIGGRPEDAAERSELLRRGVELLRKKPTKK